MKSAFVRLYFEIELTPSLTGVRFTATGTAKESGNDSTGAANEEIRSVTGDMTFGTNPASSATIAIASNEVTLERLTQRLAVERRLLDSAGKQSVSRPLRGRVGPDECFGGITCTGLELATDLSGAPAGAFSAGNQILWTSIVDAVNTNLVAIHYYDPVAVSATPPSTLTVERRPLLMRRRHVRDRTGWPLRERRLLRRQSERIVVRGRHPRQREAAVLHRKRLVLGVLYPDHRRPEERAGDLLHDSPVDHTGPLRGQDQ